MSFPCVPGSSHYLDFRRDCGVFSANFLIGWRCGNPGVYQSVQVRTSGSVRAVWQSGQSSRSMVLMVPAYAWTSSRFLRLLGSPLPRVPQALQCRGLPTRSRCGLCYQWKAHDASRVSIDSPGRCRWDACFRTTVGERLLGSIHIFFHQGKVFIVSCDNFVSLAGLAACTNSGKPRTNDP
jgi:hypothetical protein